MRAIVVEFGTDNDRVIEGRVRELGPGETVPRGEGRLRKPANARYDPQEGEPF
jgi:hypothetical protein